MIRQGRRLLLWLLGIVAGWMLLSATVVWAQEPTDFELAAPSGFGDRHNTTAWSMQWWQGRLYVGTLRHFACWRAAMWASANPALADTFYPPQSTHAECSPDVNDLPTQAEIWRWTPETDLWERVYQSPLDVPVPGVPGQFVARDVGFRGMLVFREADNRETLYVTGVSPREMYGNSLALPPPRLLASRDGETFTAVPQTAGTFLGDLPNTGLRTGTIYRGRLYLTNGSARGEGTLIEAANPAQGNDAFRAVLPPERVVWDAVAFNDALYIGLVANSGFSVVRTTAEGTPPYNLTTVIPFGGYLPDPSQSIVSFQVFNDQLYVGTYDPAELYRINPDDSWELLVGTARQTPQGWLAPRSGLDAGFGWPFNIQVYRMHVYEEQLYIGTLDISRDITDIAPNPGLDALLRHHYGFDLYRTRDGVTFETLTVDGFGDEFQIAVRTFADTPQGLFMGTGSYWYGLNLWQLPRWPVYLPLIDVVPASGSGLLP